jgi:hypothetical protein
MTAGPKPCSFGTCGALDTHPYAEGPRCDPHAPWARAGQPHPSTARYCLAICYCGACPGRGVQPLAPITDNVIDFRHKASGKRRSSPAAYREAQANTRGAAS